MTSLKDFYKNFNIEPDIENEKKRFVNRINTTVFSIMEKNTNYDERKEIFLKVCYRLGIDGEELISRANSQNYGNELNIPHL